MDFHCLQMYVRIYQMSDVTRFYLTALRVISMKITVKTNFWRELFKYFASNIPCRHFNFREPSSSVGVS